MEPNIGSSPNNEVSLILALRVVVPAVIRSLVKVKSVQRPHLDGRKLLVDVFRRGFHRVGGDLEAKREAADDGISRGAGSQELHNAPSHVSVAFSDARAGHVLPDELQTRVNELIVLLSPPPSDFQAVQVGVVSGL